jgi:Trk K+ transport system NAD-binding subunit
VVPGPSLVLQEGDVVHVIAADRDLAEIARVFAGPEPGRGSH